MSFATMKDLLDTSIQDDDQALTALEREKALQEAVVDYSIHRPRQVVSDISGDGTFDYDLPDGFTRESSTIVRVEFPAGERQPIYLFEEGWILYQAPGELQLRFMQDTPQVGDTIRLTWTAPHELSESTNTLPPLDETAVVNKAACVCCMWLASKYSELGEATLLAQSVQYQTKADHFRKQAKLFCEAYSAFMGLSGAPVAGASATTDASAPSRYPWGETRLTHRKHRYGI